jgi:3-deoxy-D-manno-octulosonate 8-phosphate phosphatase (KDO 8-P phosphatase)
MNTDCLKAVQLVLLDVDGVLTDGSIIYNDDGSETKVFNVRDGLGIRLLLDAGIGVGIVTGRSSGALTHRCRNLGIDLVFDGVRDKAALVEKIVKETGIPAGAMAFVGDDLPDLPIMARVGVAVAVADAHPRVLARARVVTAAGGGHGAVREVSEMTLRAKGLWDAVEKRFT